MPPVGQWCAMCERKCMTCGCHCPADAYPEQCLCNKEAEAIAKRYALVDEIATHLCGLYTQLGGEPHGQAAWAKMRNSWGSYLVQLEREGRIYNFETPRCDGCTNPPSTQEKNLCNVDVLVRLNNTAEIVRFAMGEPWFVNGGRS